MCYSGTGLYYLRDDAGELWCYDADQQWLKLVGDDTEGGGFPIETVEEAIAWLMDHQYVTVEGVEPVKETVIPVEVQALIKTAYDAAQGDIYYDYEEYEEPGSGYEVDIKALQSSLERLIEIIKA